MTSCESWRRKSLARRSRGRRCKATALVHEAYLRLLDVDGARHWNSRGHFFAAAAEAMRRILVENARRRSGAKHGGTILPAVRDGSDELSYLSVSARLVQSARGPARSLS